MILWEVAFLPFVFTFILLIGKYKMSYNFRLPKKFTISNYLSRKIQYNVIHLEYFFVKVCKYLKILPKIIYLKYIKLSVLCDKNKNKMYIIFFGLLVLSLFLYPILIVSIPILMPLMIGSAVEKHMVGHAVNVESFGSGWPLVTTKTDTEINAAITWAVANSKKVIYLSPGTWTCANRVDIPSNITVMGHSRETIIEGSVAGDYGIMSAYGSSGASVLLSLDATERDNSLTVADGSGFSIGDYILIYDAQTAFLWEINRLSNVAGNVLTTGNKLRESYTVANTTRCVKLTPTENVTIYDVKFNNSDCGVSCRLAVNFNLINCEVIGFTKYGIQLNTSTQLQIIGNYCHDAIGDSTLAANNECIMLFEIQDSVVQDNKVNRMRRAIDLINQSHDNLIDSNVCNGTYAVCISSHDSDCKRNIISNNICDGSTYYGITSVSSNNTIKGNYIKNCVQYGIWLSNGAIYNLVEANQIENCENGIYCYTSTCYQNTISNNIITYSKTAAIYLDTTVYSIRILNNTFVNNGYGVNAEEVNYVMVIGNYFYNADSPGFTCYDAIKVSTSATSPHDWQIMNNYINNMNWMGIEINIGNATYSFYHCQISGNTILNSTRHGLYCLNVRYCLIENNMIYDNDRYNLGYDGIYFSGTNNYNTISGNYISNLTASRQRYGINFSSNSSTNMVVSNNYLRSNLTGAINNSGLYIIFFNNVGYTINQQASWWINNSGGALAYGDVVILDTSVNDGTSITTTTTEMSALWRGAVYQSSIANGSGGFILTKGYHPALKVTTNAGANVIAIGDGLGTSGTVKMAALSTQVGAIALEALGAGDGTIKAELV